MMYTMTFCNAYSHETIAVSPRNIRLAINATATDKGFNAYLVVENRDSFDSTSDMLVKFGGEVRRLQYPYHQGVTRELFWPLTGDSLELALKFGIAKIRLCENRGVVDEELNISADKVKEAYDKIRRIQERMYRKMMLAEDF